MLYRCVCISFFSVLVSFCTAFAPGRHGSYLSQHQQLIRTTGLVGSFERHEKSFHDEDDTGSRILQQHNTRYRHRGGLRRETMTIQQSRSSGNGDLDDDTRARHYGNLTSVLGELFSACSMVMSNSTDDDASSSDTPRPAWIPDGLHEALRRGDGIDEGVESSFKVDQLIDAWKADLDAKSPWHVKMQTSCVVSTLRAIFRFVETKYIEVVRVEKQVMQLIQTSDTTDLASVIPTDDLVLQKEGFSISGWNTKITVWKFALVLPEDKNINASDNDDDDDNRYATGYWVSQDNVVVACDVVVDDNRAGVNNSNNDYRVYTNPDPRYAQALEQLKKFRNENDRTEKVRTPSKSISTRTEDSSGALAPNHRQQGTNKDVSTRTTSGPTISSSTGFLSQKNNDQDKPRRTSLFETNQEEQDHYYKNLQSVMAQPVVVTTLLMGFVGDTSALDDGGTPAAVPSWAEPLFHASDVEKRKDSEARDGTATAGAGADPAIPQTTTTATQKAAADRIVDAWKADVDEKAPWYIRRLATSSLSLGILRTICRSIEEKSIEILFQLQRLEDRAMQLMKTSSSSHESLPSELRTALLDETIVLVRTAFSCEQEGNVLKEKFVLQQPTTTTKNIKHLGDADENTDANVTAETTTTTLASGLLSSRDGLLTACVVVVAGVEYEIYNSTGTTV